MAVRWTDRLTTRLERDGSKTTRMETDGGQEECGLEMDGLGAQYYDAKWVKKAITRLVLVETLGGIAPPTKQFLHVFAKEAAGSKTDRTEYGAASASASSFVVHHTQQISMAAVVGDAENINKQARNKRKDWLNSPARANWVKNKQEANGFLRSAPVGGARAA